MNETARRNYVFNVLCLIEGDFGGYVGWRKFVAEANVYSEYEARRLVLDIMHRDGYVVRRIRRLN
jgi:hypothetical protein